MPADCSYRIEPRDGVGIDRFTGGAAHGAKFDLAVVTNATFTTTLNLANFELWQLGLLACVLYDLREGLVAIGSGKSRGLGQVTGVVRWVEVCFPAHLSPPAHSARIWGLRALEREADCAVYGYWSGEEEGISMEGIPALSDPLGLRIIYRLETPEVLMGLWRQIAPLATRYLAQYELAQRMRF
jgi:hypothetical protein